jgi:putative molybdopterin biosynthesis protein
MASDISYTIEEVAKLLRVSKLTVYDLIKKGKLPAYRVGRQMRVDDKDLQVYKASSKGSVQVATVTQVHSDTSNAPLPSNTPLPSIAPAAVNPSQSNIENTDQSQRLQAPRSIIITGQDPSLDLLSRYVERHSKLFRPLRSYAGSLDSLIALYKGEADIVSTHLFDGDTGQYNIPYIRKFFVSRPYIVLRLLSRKIGIYVQKGNPKQIFDWHDLIGQDRTIVNREPGSGARTLLDEQLRIHGLSAKGIQGYDRIETNHIGVAGKVASGDADAGVGVEHAAVLVDVDFIPKAVEHYDLVMLKRPGNQELIATVQTILHSPDFRKELGSIRGYDLSETGRVIYEYGAAFI